MPANYRLIHTSVLALLRGDLKAGDIADRFGVTEAEVHEWRDTFLVGGVQALHEFLSGDLDKSSTPFPEEPSSTESVD